MARAEAIKSKTFLFNFINCVVVDEMKKCVDLMEWSWMEWLTARSIKKFHFFNYAVIGYGCLARFNSNSTPIPSTLLLSLIIDWLVCVASAASLLFIKEKQEGKGHEWKWRKSFTGMSWPALEGPPAHNPQTSWISVCGRENKPFNSSILNQSSCCSINKSKLN